MRTGPLTDAGPIELVEGEEVLLSPTAKATVGRTIAVGLPDFASLVVKGQRVLLDDGNLDVEVKGFEADGVLAIVRHGGTLSSHKGINLPGRRVAVPAITNKDLEDLQFSLEVGLDWLALSFVQEPKDVVMLKRLIAVAGKSTPVIAKIEKPLAVENLAAIIDVSDGIMVARGDLGVEIGPEKLPNVQKEIIRLARQKTKLVITATQMLESMTHSPRPTRAEASDVANAIYDGTDVVMLSGETAVGQYPLETVTTMRDIALNVEASSLYRESMALLRAPEPDGVAQATVRAASSMAEEIGAKALVAFSASGRTAASIAGHRPRVPLFAMVHSVEALRRLALCWAIQPILIGQADSLKHLYRLGIDALVRKGYVTGGDRVVLVSGSVTGGYGANMIRVEEVSRRRTPPA
jgi:pyruvate kinase